MVAVAAREFSVPVVGVAGTFTLTPLFAHNQVTDALARTRLHAYPLSSPHHIFTPT
jgi:translation initiation factor 2B subunit (eIF-2B alpha/beta/delta family)